MQSTFFFPVLCLAFCLRHAIVLAYRKNKVNYETLSSWANLHDARAKKLTRFGKVHPELESILDQDIQNLAEIALHLSTILSKSQQEKP